MFIYAAVVVPVPKSCKNTTRINDKIRDPGWVGEGWGTRGGEGNTFTRGILNPIDLVLIILNELRNVFNAFRNIGGKIRYISELSAFQNVDTSSVRMLCFDTATMLPSLF